MLKIKTINGAFFVNQPPNGEWGWVVMVASFFILGNTFGTSKSLGIYFLDIKHEFGVTNSATSWISSLFLGAIALAGLFTTFISSRMDARVRIMFGGLLASVGLLLSAFSPSLLLVYIGSFLAGAGHGIAFLTATSQVSLYFSTLRPLATGIMLAGSPVCSTLFPFLNNYLLARYGWRDSFWILSAISLNTVMLGALMHPIENVSIIESHANISEKKENLMTVAKDQGIENVCMKISEEPENQQHKSSYAAKFQSKALTCSNETFSSKDFEISKNADCEGKLERLQIETLVKPATSAVSASTSRKIVSENNAGKSTSIGLQVHVFVTRYWAALCLVFVHFILDLCIFVPNIYLVPLTRGLGYSPDEGAMLLSFISIGDIICRPLSGVLITRFKILADYILLSVATLLTFMMLNQLLAVFTLHFSVLILYTLLHGCLFGFISTATVSAVPLLMGTKNIDKYFGMFFAVGSSSLLASAPFAGVFVDVLDDYRAAYWYTFMCLVITSVFCLIMYFVVKIRGGVVLQKNK